MEEVVRTGIERRIIIKIKVTVANKKKLKELDVQLN